MYKRKIYVCNFKLFESLKVLKIFSLKMDDSDTSLAYLDWLTRLVEWDLLDKDLNHRDRPSVTEEFSFHRP